MSRLEIRALAPDEIGASLDELAALRIRVFRDWPYLYEGDLAYERAYLEPYRKSPGAVVVGAYDGARLVGAATGTPMNDHADDFAAPLAASGLDLAQLFYCAESVLMPEYRGQGVGHRFFELREAHAAALGCGHVAFCSVLRPEDHPARPPSYRPLDGFWRGRGYQPLPGAVAEFAWRDIGETAQSVKPLQVWIKELP